MWLSTGLIGLVWLSMLCSLIKRCINVPFLLSTFGVLLVTAGTISMLKITIFSILEQSEEFVKLIYILSSIIEVFVLLFAAFYYLYLASRLRRYLASIDRPMLGNIRTELVG